MLDLLWTTQILSDMYYYTALCGQFNLHPLDMRKHRYFEFVGVIRDRAEAVELNSHRRWRNSLWVREETVGNCGIVRGTVGPVRLSMSAGVTLNIVGSVLGFINKWNCLLSESHIRVFSLRMVSQLLCSSHSEYKWSGREHEPEKQTLKSKAVQSDLHGSLKASGWTYFISEQVDYLSVWMLVHE